MARSARRRARESALQVLYQLDESAQETWDVERALEGYFANFEHAEPARAFARELVQGVAMHRPQIDQCILATSTSWRLERMSAVDRNLLRLGTFELLHGPEVPAAVVINEAVEIARRFGSESSAAFVNGILDEIARRNGRTGSPGPGGGG
ncbi:MAG: transcription antitermination factor NusB [Pseudomonadota bacterium]